MYIVGFVSPNIKYKQLVKLVNTIVKMQHSIIFVITLEHNIVAVCSALVHQQTTTYIYIL